MANYDTLKLAYSVYVNPGAEIVLDQADVPSLEALGPTVTHKSTGNQTKKAERSFIQRTQMGLRGCFRGDPETGHIEVIKIWMVADHGVVLNPLLLQGQIKGG